jgi:hypothetical protein
LLARHRHAGRLPASLIQTRSFVNVVAGNVEFLAWPRSSSHGAAHDTEAEPAYGPGEEPF